jgi:predicted DNA-binding transcriptional regulator YafY
MQIFKYIDRINLLDKLIRQGRTGSPSDLAKRLGVSTSRLYVIIDQLKDMGAPIEYSRQQYSYYYEYEYSISISVTFQALDQVSLSSISGGQSFFFNFY